MQKEKLSKVVEFLNSDKFLKSKKSYFCIFVIFYILMIGIDLVGVEIKPPEKSEYNVLYEQAKKLEENFGNIVKMKNASCNFDTGKMEVILQSEKNHFLKVTFNYDLNRIVKYEEFDNITSIYWILIKSLFGTILITLMAVILMRVLAYSNSLAYEE